MKAHLLKPSGERVEVVPANGKTFTLAECQAHIGGYIEVVGLPNTNAHILIVDEDGFSKNLPPNYVATTIAGHLIVGNALLMPSKGLE